MAVILRRKGLKNAMQTMRQSALGLSSSIILPFVRSAPGKASATHRSIDRIAGFVMRPLHFDDLSIGQLNRPVE